MALTVDLAVDLVVLTIRHGTLNILLIRRAKDPFIGRWALPGGRVDKGEKSADAARRELHEETGIHAGPGMLEGFGSYATPGRDPRGCIISVAWLALLPDPGEPTAGSDAKAACWRPVRDATGLAFDHDHIVRDGLEVVRAEFEHTPLATALCAPDFALDDLRGVYEAVWDTTLDPDDFAHDALRIRGFLHPTSRQQTGPIGPADQLYRRGTADILYPPLRRPTARTPTSTATCDTEQAQP